MQLAVAAVDLEREQVLPLGAADVQERGLVARAVSQQQEGVVVDRHLPEIGVRRSPRRRVKSPRNQRDRSIRCTPWSISSPPPDSAGVGAPFLVVADAPAVAVAAADEHQLAERAGVEQLARLLQRRVIAVIEADAHQPPRARAPPRSPRRSRQPIAPPASRRGRACRPRPRARATSASASLVVATIDDVDVGAVDRGSPVVGRRRARRGARQRLRARRAFDVGAGDEPRARRAPPRASGPIRPQPTIATPRSDAHPFITGPPRQAAIRGHDAAQRVDVGARRSSRCSGSVSHGSHSGAQQLAGDAVARRRRRGTRPGSPRRRAARRPAPSVSAIARRTPARRAPGRPRAPRRAAAC